MADKPVIKLKNYVPEDKNNFEHESVNPSAAKDDNIQVLQAETDAEQKVDAEQEGAPVPVEGK